MPLTNGERICIENSSSSSYLSSSIQSSRASGISLEDLLDLYFNDEDHGEPDEPLDVEDMSKLATEAAVEMAIVQTDLGMGDPVMVEIGRLGRRCKRLIARVRIEADPDRVWDVLTDYENLPEFIPSLAKCERMQHPSGGIRLLQVGAQSLPYIHFEAKVIMDLEENRNKGELSFQMIEGDFHIFQGRWQLSRIDGSSAATLLEYSVDVKPKMSLPAMFIGTIIRKDLPVNLLAVRQRAEMLSQIQDSMYHLLVDDNGSTTTIAAPVSSPSPIPSPLTRSPSPLPPGYQLLKDAAAGPIQDASVETIRNNSGWLRRISAGFEVAADAQTAWKVLTDYEGLISFVPNLARSEVLPHPEGKIRLLQVGVKYQLYFQFQARAVLDVEEEPYSAIRFTMVEGDFEHFNGLWTITPLAIQSQIPNKNSASSPTFSPTTVQGVRVQYTVDIRPKGRLPFGIVEKIISKDLPSSLCAVRQRIQKMQTEQATSLQQMTDDGGSALVAIGAPRSSTVQQSKKQPRYYSNFENLARELLEYVEQSSSPGVMPKYWALRDSGRNDLVKAIAYHGGFAPVAKKVGLEMTYQAKKPWGYWDNLSNLERELLAFIEEHGTPGVMPTRASLRRMSRHDIAKAADKYGGISEVANLLNLKLVSPRVRRARSSPDGEEETFDQDDYRGILGEDYDDSDDDWDFSIGDDSIFDIYRPARPKR
eukprot:CAMPEP_0184656852 /NCGR_PEP_ID=MMETSP0308-20130426/16800_1 /TAXON_ID=38269 /ORGANISM="Gloeochaete witrockiana, Strain SAG 46.84" /LENGTH=703 /DNA_ID=CAMNT_0027094161 /DNA_START=444 /DNA_END=2555 /DNA_ORIENTATION=-